MICIDNKILLIYNAVLLLLVGCRHLFIYIYVYYFSSFFKYNIESTELKFPVVLINYVFCRECCV